MPHSVTARSFRAGLALEYEDLCYRARAARERAQEERGRAQELASERLGRCHTDAVVVDLGTGQVRRRV